MRKQHVKDTLARLAGGLGLWSALERAHRDAWTIVCYHRILPAAERVDYFCPDLVVTPASFRAHCAVYREHFEVLPVREAFERRTNGAPVKKPLLSISFDDGYRDNLEFAAPILAEHGLRASFYVIAGLVDTEELPWYDHVALAQSTSAEGRALVASMKSLSNEERLRRVQEIPVQQPKTPEWDCIMTVAQLESLQRAGHEIGSHSLTHPILPRVERGGLSTELAGSRGMLSDLLHAPVSTFCYPNGDFDATVLAEVERAGYSAALSTQQGLNRAEADPFRLRRVFIHEDWLRDGAGCPSPALLRAELAFLHRFRH